MAEQFAKDGQLTEAKIFKKKADIMTDRARIIHESVFSQELLSEDIVSKNLKK
ncbi:MAG: hypothetical protein Q7U54_16830 [Bacteroidales bacterium]|nr:hypothetical protein [Bacteroidales bacterium]